LGSPQPHKSWREFTLLTVLIGLTLFVIYNVVRMYLGSWFISLVQRKAFGGPSNVSVSNQQQAKRVENEDRTLMERKIMVEQ
jgi:hypothetical protein